MGHNVSTLWSPVVITVKTGDRKGAGTDAKIKIRLHDSDGWVSPDITLDNMFKDDFERNTANSFSVQRGFPDCGSFTAIEIISDQSGLMPDWYVDTIHVLHRRLEETFVFPIYRWIKEKRVYIFRCLDVSLPQFDPYHEQRRDELRQKRDVYKYCEKYPGAPVQVENLPKDEQFSEKYRVDLMHAKFKLLGEKFVFKILSQGDYWDSLDHLSTAYRGRNMHLPKVAKSWKNDNLFAAQRLMGSNPVLIKLCNSIPNNFGVTDEMVTPITEGSTIAKLISERRLYIVDLKILEDIKPADKKRVLCAPLALFFVNNEGKLMPLAIQLFQTPSQNNPVFLPTDGQYTWLAAKMWYNNADSAYHQSLTHLGFTHLLMEGAAICSHRNISPSHPVFKLLAPHFFNIMAINSLALEKLVSPGGWIDKTMASGASGLFDIVVKAWKDWRLDVDGTLPNELKNRQVDDAKSLPNYHYRDDALLCYDAIKSYVTEIIDIYYDSGDTLKQDDEIQNWALELCKSVPDGGCGIKVRI
ncbi:allene oxide synthase-lipoxygenase protein-like isoform X1 [Tubulanus polymorphus]|uniref:allene oxide synthase-lipoxygenase protein-like isoform X1 n=1 Tax=Tubulanus polymorphus TaxID=672921 RepID=UPI003DA68EC0